MLFFRIYADRAKNGLTKRANKYKIVQIQNNIIAVVGAFLKQINGNYKVGNSEHFIIEACEYVESFLKFSPKTGIVLNIDNDHLDYFKNFENIVTAFRKYVALLPYDGLLVVNADDKNCLDLRNYTEAKFVTFGIESEKANFIARNITYDKNGFAKFDVYHKYGTDAVIDLSLNTGLFSTI